MKTKFVADGDFAAFYIASKWLAGIGFSIGSMQRDAPIGIMFGDFDIQKWRNLSSVERNALHGVVTGDKRNGPITVELFDFAPKEAKQVFTECA